jgi:hypothetical protein
MPRRIPAVYDPVNAKLYGQDPIRGLLEVQGTGGGGGNVTIDSTIGDIFSATGSTIRGDAVNEDKIVYWDQSLGRLTYLAIGGGLTINGQSIESDVQGSITLSIDTNITDVLSVSSSGYNLSFTADTAGSDKVVFWDHSSGKLTYLTIGSGLEISGTTLSTPGISNDGNINLDPSGSNSIIAKGNSNRGSGEIVLNCEQNTHGVTLKGPPHSAGATYTFTLPGNAGSNGQVLSTNGSGTTSWIPALSLNSSVTDVLSESNGAISGVDANADKILFWDDSAGKTTYLTVGNNLTLSGTTLSADQQTFAITESSQVINTNYTLSSGKNGHSVGPVEIANNYTVTIPNNAVWLVS